MYKLLKFIGSFFDNAAFLQEELEWNELLIKRYIGREVLKLTKPFLIFEYLTS